MGLLFEFLDWALGFGFGDFVVLPLEGGCGCHVASDLGINWYWGTRFSEKSKLLCTIDGPELFSGLRNSASAKSAPRGSALSTSVGPRFLLSFTDIGTLHLFWLFFAGAFVLDAPNDTRRQTSSWSSKTWDGVSTAPSQTSQDRPIWTRRYTGKCHS